jgi:vitamin B12 transporter
MALQTFDMGQTFGRRGALAATTAMAAIMLAVSPAALAQAPAAPLADGQEDDGAEHTLIVVTGTATPVEYEKIGNTITIIGGEAIETRATAYLQDVLREVPGVAVNQGGSFGSQTQVRIRGAEGNHVLVLVDGIEVSAIGSGEFDFSSLLANNIDRVEVLRGPQSGLYGSNALAGVINVITKGGDAPAFDAALEYGSFDSRFARAAVTLGDRETFLSASGIYRETDGFSTAANGTEADGDRNLTLYLRGGARLDDRARLDATLRIVDKHTDTDGFDFSGGAMQGLAVDDDSFGKSQDWSGGLALTLEPVDRWETVLSASYMHRDAANGFGTVESSGDEGYRRSFAARSSLGFDTPGLAQAAHSVTLFLEHEQEGYRNTFPTDPSQWAEQTRSLLGYGAEYRLDLFDSLFLRGAVRRDENDDFADATTFSLSGSWVLGPTRLHASYGTGVTNPTFFEQFGFVPGTFVGNPGLVPEKARGFDVGVEQRLFDDRLLVDVTYFNSNLTDEIISVYPSVENDFGKSKRQGVELSARWHMAGFDLGGSYTYLDATDPDGSKEVRRPRHQASFDVSGRFGPDQRGTFSAGVIYNGAMLDNDYRNYFSNGFQLEKSRLDSYTVVRLAASYRLTHTVELFGRLENALDESYQQTISYAAPGRAIYGGVKFVLP